MKTQLLQPVPNTPEDETDRGLGLSGDVNSLLLDPGASKKDLAIARRAIKEKWPISESTRRHLVKRLVKVTRKEAVLVPFGVEGVLMPMDSPADSNAIAATKVLVQMMGQNQADEHHATPSEDPTKPTVNNFNGCLIALPADERRSRVAAVLERVRSSRIIDVPAGDGTGVDRTATDGPPASRY